MPLDGLEGSIRNGMLDPAGILRRRFRVNAQAHEHPGNDRVALEDLLRSGPALIRQKDPAKLADFQVALLLQQMHRPADT